MGSSAPFSIGAALSRHKAVQVNRALKRREYIESGMATPLECDIRLRKARGFSVKRTAIIVERRERQFKHDACGRFAASGRTETLLRMSSGLECRSTSGFAVHLADFAGLNDDTSSERQLDVLSLKHSPSPSPLSLGEGGR
jgi:hypothetical protein